MWYMKTLDTMTPEHLWDVLKILLSILRVKQCFHLFHMLLGTFLPLQSFLLKDSIIVAADAARLVQHLVELRIVVISWDSPLMLSKALVAFTIFLNALLYLLLVQTLHCSTLLGSFHAWLGD